jgi:hypothetical protein
VLRFMLKVATHDDPPDRHLATKPIVKDQGVERGVGKTRNDLTSLLPKNTQPFKDCEIACTIAHGSGSCDGFDTRQFRIPEFSKQPLISIDEVLSDIGKAECLFGWMPAGTSANRFSVDSRTALANSDSLSASLDTCAPCDAQRSFGCLTKTAKHCGTCNVCRRARFGKLGVMPCSA